MPQIEATIAPGQPQTTYSIIGIVLSIEAGFHNLKVFGLNNVTISLFSELYNCTWIFFFVTTVFTILAVLFFDRSSQYVNTDQRTLLVCVVFFSAFFVEFVTVDGMAIQDSITSSSSGDVATGLPGYDTVMISLSEIQTVPRSYPQNGWTYIMRSLLP